MQRNFSGVIVQLRRTRLLFHAEPLPPHRQGLTGTRPERAGGFPKFPGRQRLSRLSGPSSDIVARGSSGHSTNHQRFLGDPHRAKGRQSSDIPAPRTAEGLAHRGVAGQLSSATSTSRRGEHFPTGQSLRWLGGWESLRSRQSCCCFGFSRHHLPDRSIGGFAYYPSFDFSATLVPPRLNGGALALPEENRGRTGSAPIPASDKRHASSKPALNVPQSTD